ncbi:MAG: hypothetical protein ACREDU_11125, partial [Methylocella sp.]
MSSVKDLDPTTETAAADERAYWTVEDAEELYRVKAWGDSFFFIKEDGHVAVRPLQQQSLAIDIYAVVQDLRQRNVSFPALIRFQDVLQARVVRLNKVFIKAIRDSGYRNRYQGVYP